MRLALIVLLSSVPAFASCAQSFTPRAGYASVRTLCVDHTKVGTVGNTDQANFPVIATFTNSDWATVANGGKIQNTVTQSGGASITVPADFVLTSDSLGTTLCTGWEFGKYVATTGQVVLYYDCGTASHSTDTPAYVSVGNASVNTQQYTVSLMWPNAKGIWHLDSLDGSSPFHYTDSSSNGGNATTTVNATVAGVVGLAVDDTGGTANTPTYTGGAGLPTGSSARTIEAWANTRGNGCSNTTGQYGVLGYGGNGSNQEMVISCFGLSGHQLGIDYGGANCAVVFSNTDSNFHQFAGVLTGTTVNTTHFYVDGVDGSCGSSSGGNTVATTAANLTIANYASFSNRFLGYVDECRIWSVAQTADWISTEYNSISSPGTFVTISSPSNGGNMPPAILGIIMQPWQMEQVSI